MGTNFGDKDLLGKPDTVFRTPAGNEYILGLERQLNVRTATRDSREYIIKAIQPRERNQYERELNVIAYLRKTDLAPNIIAPVEFFDNEKGAYIVFPKKTALDLEALTKKEPLSIERIEMCVQKAGSMLHRIHQQGVVHGDVKPANILLPETYIDFQLSRRPGDNGIPAMPGFWLGSLCYTAPEHMLGDNDEKDVSNDVYSFGATIYYMLTGVRPHADDTSGAHYISKRIVKGELTPPEQLRKDTPERLARVVKRALHRSPQERHPNVEALLDDLASVAAPKGHRVIPAQQPLVS